MIRFVVYSDNKKSSCCWDSRPYCVRRAVYSYLHSRRYSQMETYQVKQNSTIRL